MSTANRVKFGLKNCHYAKATFAADGSVSYAKPVPIPGAVNLSLDPEGESDSFYADDGVYYAIAANNGYSGDLEIAIIPESFATDIMHEEEDANGVLIENKEVEPEHFALLFEFSGDQRKIRHCIYNCTAKRSGISSGTIENSKQPKTDKLALVATSINGGYVKAKTGTNTTETTYEGWFGNVYMPAAKSSGSGTSTGGKS